MVIQDKHRTVSCDIEANGLTPDTIWCIVCKDLKTKHIYKFTTPHEINNIFPVFAKTVKKWVGHNFIGYDVPVLHRLVQGVHIKTKDVIDTLVLSRLANYGREGGHSLANWGEVLGYAKVVHEDWDSACQANQVRIVNRCVVDVELTEKVFTHLKEELEGFSMASIRLEHNIAKICEDIQRNGFNLDMPKAIELRDKLLKKSTNLRTQMEREMPLNRKLLREGKIKYNKDGTISKVTKKTFDNPKYLVELDDDGENYQVYIVTKFNPDSPKQCVEALNQAGWKPTDVTKSGKSYKVNETNLNTLSKEAPACYKALRTFKIASTRLKVVQSWLDSANEWGDGRVHGRLIHIGAGTHRMAHQAPNMANVASPRALYGKESRECLCAPEGYNILGTDAKGIQLRLLAHFMNDPKYTHEVLEGDPHTANLMAMGIPKGKWDEKHKQWSARATAKTFIYTWLMNGGDALVGKICTGKLNRKVGKAVKQRFLNSIPSLSKFRNSHKAVAERGYVKMFDGRRIIVTDEHYVMPTYLQGGEAVIMKTALVLWYTEAKKKHIDFKLVAFVHDEWQTEVREDQAELLSRMQNNAIIKAGEMYNLNCPMEGDSSIGLNWAETH